MCGGGGCGQWIWFTHVLTCSLKFAVVYVQSLGGTRPAQAVIVRGRDSLGVVCRGVWTLPPSVGVPRGPVAWQRVTARPAAIWLCGGVCWYGVAGGVVNMPFKWAVAKKLYIFERWPVASTNTPKLLTHQQYIFNEYNETHGECKSAPSNINKSEVCIQICCTCTDTLV